MEPQRQAARQFVEAIALPIGQFILRWGPAGTSGTAFIFFLSQQQWAIALWTFPATIVTVAWVKYSNRFLQQLGEIYHERGKGDASRLVRFLDAVDETLRWQFAGNRQYLKCQGAACRDYITVGFHSSFFLPQLREVFVPLDLSSSFFRDRGGEALPMPPGFKWDDKIIQLVEQREGLRIWDLLKHVKKVSAYRRLAVLAWGGYGKTTLLRHITYTYTNPQLRRKLPSGVPSLIPVLLYLRTWQDVIATEMGLDLATLIERHHIPKLPEASELKLPPNWAKNLLREGKIIVMFDGFDEVRPEWRSPISEWIGWQMQNHQKSVFILTSRPGGYKDYTSQYKPSAQLFVKAFNRKQQERFIERWYLCQEWYARGGSNDREVRQLVKFVSKSQTANLLAQFDSNPDLKDLAKNPLMLNMMVNLHRSYQGQDLPERRAELYGEICTLQLKNRPRMRGIFICLPAPECQRILQQLALEMVQDSQLKMKADSLLEKLQVYLHSLGESVDPRQFLKEMEQVSELLVKPNEQYEFAHLSFRNYLAAVEIANTQQESVLLQHWQEASWRETILFYTAIVNPTNFVRQLCAIDSPEAIDLAYNCLKESPRQVDSQVEQQLEALKSEVKDRRYQKLKEYLKNQQWKEADRETFHLMLQTVRKEADQHLDREDIENFPCEDLRTLDRLWVKASSGLFGFSVQKEIWKRCGGKVDLETECKLGDAVGWRDAEGDYWLAYDSLTFSGGAPVGHLPLSFWVWGESGVPGRSLLVQRLVNCNCNHR